MEDFTGSFFYWKTFLAAIKCISVCSQKFQRIKVGIMLYNFPSKVYLIEVQIENSLEILWKIAKLFKLLFKFNFHSLSPIFFLNGYCIPQIKPKHFNLMKPSMKLYHLKFFLHAFYQNVDGKLKQPNIEIKDFVGKA